MTRSESIVKLLKGLSTLTPDIEAAAVVDNDGLMIASSLPQDIEEDAVAAMTAALLGLSERVGEELSRGEFKQVLLQATNGFAVLSRAGQDAVLTVLTRPNAKLGLIFLDVGRASKEIGKLLAG